MDSNPAQPRQFRRITISRQQKRQLILAIPVTCLVTSLATFSWLQFQTAQAETRLQQTQQVRLEAQRLHSDLLKADTAVRGYEITRRQDFLTGYESAIAQIPVSLEQLRQLVAQEHSQTHRLQRIRQLATARITLLQRNLRLVNSQPETAIESPEFIAQLLEGKQVMDQVNDEIQQFLAIEQQQQTQLNQQLEQQRQFTGFVLALAAIIGIGGSTIAAYLSYRLEQHLQKSDRRWRESEARYRAVVENFPHGAVLLFNHELRYLLADGSGLAPVSLSKTQLEGNTIWECFPPQTSTQLEPIYRQVLAGETVTREIPFQDRIFSVHALPVKNQTREIIAGMVVTQDITERKRSEQELYSANRALRTLSECNQALVLATDETTLLHNICQIIVEFGGYRCVWIGFAETDDAKTVHPVAQAGYEDNYIETLQISWGDNQRGTGPTGTAIRTQEPRIIQNILTDPTYQLWRDGAIKQGYAASIALPLIVEGTCLGALNIYASEADAFNQAEVRLLTELANDLAYGISALRTQVALRQNKQRLDSILNALDDMVWSVCATTHKVLYLNPATERVYGRPVQDFFDHPNLWLEVVHPDDYAQVSTFRQQLLAQGTYSLEYRIQRPDGEIRWFCDRGRVTYDEDGYPLRLDGIASDITDRKQAEEALRVSQERWHLALRGNNDGIWDWNVKTNQVFLSPRWKEMLGYEDDEIANHVDEWSKRVHPDDLEWVMGLIQDHFDQKTPYYSSEHRLLCKDGSYKWILDRGQALWDESGTVVRMVGSHTDISDRKAAEAALQYQLDFDQLVATISTRFINLASADIQAGITQALAEIGAFTQVDTSYIFQMSQDGQTVRMTHEWVTPGINRQIHACPEVSISTFPWEFAQLQRGEVVYIPNINHLPDQATLDRHYWQASHRCSHIAVPLIYQGTMMGWVGFDSFRQEKIWSDSCIHLLRIVGEILTNAWQRQKAEAALGESEARFRAMFENSKAIKLLIDAETGAITDANWAAVDFYGYSRSQLITKKITDLNCLLPTQVKAEMRRAKLEERTYFVFPHRLASGEIREVEVYSSPIEIQGRIFLVSIIHDVTERKQAERALQDSEERFRAIFEQASVGIAVAKPSGELLRVNQRYCDITGYPESELVGRLVQDITHPDDREQNKGYLQQLMAGESSNYSLEKRYIRKDGKWRWVYISISRVHDSEKDQNYALAVVEDISDRKATEAALRESEAKFRAFLESASEAIIVTKAQGEIVIFNAKAEELFGYNRTEVFGREIEYLMPQRYHFIHSDYRADYLAHPSKRAMGKSKTLSAKRRDGSEFPIEVGLSTIQTQNGTFVIVFLTDITERQQAENEIKRLNQKLECQIRETETRYAQIVELAEEGIWVIDAQGNTTYINQAMARMLGYTEVEMLGHAIADFITPGDNYFAPPFPIQLNPSQVHRQEVQLCTKAGNKIWAYMSTSPVLDDQGKLLWSCALVYDITERKQAEKQLRESNERISLANAELARATRLKDEFLASMSHELRTPLNAILGLAEALQEEVYGELTAKQRKSLVTIEQSGKHLLDLINDILDLSKIESGKMSFSLNPVSVDYLCTSSLTFIKQQAQQKNIKLHYQIASVVSEIEVDERRLRQVLVNLLSNGVKFTPYSGEVSLQVTADPDNEQLQFSVTDTGIGIAPENLNKLFKPFVQLDSSLSRRYAGTGLGLALVRRIVELQGGSITLESEVGKGSCFTVTLPWKHTKLKGQTLRETKLVSKELPPIHNALVVEDSDASANHIARYLRELGVTVLIHPQGEGTIDAVHKFKPDVIILDILLPDISGWEVLLQLKGNPATASIPVVVVSVVDDPTKALELGASDYLLKPVSRPQLQSVLSQLFAPTSQSDYPPVAQELPLILLAEDNEANILTMTDYLHSKGFRVVLARNGIEAVQQAKQHTPDLILMDIQMPEMDGLEATCQIRADMNLPRMPIIAVTALAMPGDREKCLASGVTDYLAKPISLKKLVTLIEQYLNRE
ncbi:PAS domain S-box protein [Coleofasciculus sp. G2-EDA-02]|uniref:PAS domain S-box protein n=1 Tax=Coleofasciculus sp. G2-EDA-02 TaxID=3069529 RepID=UPI0032F19CF6